MHLAVDAGGTSTRAVVLDTSGHAYGYGRAGAGNPTAAGIGPAVSAIGSAAGRALADTTSAERPTLALIAMAGEKTAAFREQVVGRLAALGLHRVVLEHDLLGIFHSGTAALDGDALIAGTGTGGGGTPGGPRDRWRRGAVEASWTGWRVARVGCSGMRAAASGLGTPSPGQWSPPSTDRV